MRSQNVESSVPKCQHGVYQPHASPNEVCSICCPIPVREKGAYLIVRRQDGGWEGNKQ
jgi:hypothetical protein